MRKNMEIKGSIGSAIEGNDDKYTTSISGRCMKTEITTYELKKDTGYRYSYIRWTRW